jgi:hypothetical protein
VGYDRIHNIIPIRKGKKYSMKWCRVYPILATFGLTIIKKSGLITSKLQNFVENHDLRL